MNATTPGSGCPNPNFCYAQGCLGRCGAGADIPVVLSRRRDSITADDVIKKLQKMGGDPVTVNKIEMAIAAIQGKF